MELHPILEKDTAANEGLWYVVSATGESPSQRVGVTCLQAGQSQTSNGKLYVIAGANPSGPFNEVYVLDLDSFWWDTCEATGLCARYEHAAMVSQSDLSSIYVFAGANQAGNLNDVQVLDIMGNKWSNVMATGNSPSPRTHHTSCIIDNQLVIYSGGHNGADPVGDRQVYLFNTATKHWSTLSLANDPPKPRHGHVMVAIGNQILVHGGMAGTTFYDDLHTFDIDKKSWRNVKNKRGFPSARAGHASVSYGRDMYIFGGMSKLGALDDMYSFNIDSMSWATIELEGPSPASRLDFGMCLIHLKTTTADQSGDEDLVATATKAKEAIEQQISNISIGTPSQGSPNTSREDSAGSLKMSPQPDLSPLKLLDISHHASGDSQNASAAEIDSVQSDHNTVPFILIFGGMDTEGEIFDDCLVYRLNSHS